jgi:hypothetical protein
MRKLLLVLSVLCAIALARPAEGIRGMCAAAAFFGFQSELLNNLCWIELEMNSGPPPDQHDYPYNY